MLMWQHDRRRGRFLCGFRFSAEFCDRPSNELARQWRLILLAVMLQTVRREREISAASAAQVASVEFRIEEIRDSSAGSALSAYRRQRLQSVLATVTSSSDYIC